MCFCDLALMGIETVSVPPALLKGYEGLYDQGNGFAYEISTDGKKLLVRTSYNDSWAAGTIAYLPASESVFFNADFGIEL